MGAFPVMTTSTGNRIAMHKGKDHSSFIERGKRGGFTFTEVMISLFFLNVIILLFLGIATMTIRSSQKLLDLSSGALVCGVIMEHFLYDTPYPPCGLTSGTAESEGKNFEYKIDVVSVVPHMRKVDVKVFWRDSSTEYMEGYGKLYMGISTIIRENIAGSDDE